jgi:LPXTG-motif cell wall-anchored protein
MLTILAVGAIGLAFTVRVSAQVQTSTSTEHKASSHEVKVEHGEVLVVDGNDLVIKMEDGSIRHLADVPESSKVMVDGRELGVHELKPGMHLSKTVTTVTTPKVITTTQTVTGKVWHVSPPQTVILTMDDGTNQSFKIPKGQKFTVNGKETDAFGLKKGMRVSATKVVEEPITVVEQQAKLTGRMPPPPPPPAADQPILIAVVTPAAAAPAAASEPAPAALPKTGSNLPLIGLLGLLLLAGSGLLKLFQTARH